MATFSFTLEHIEKVIYKEYLSVEADTFEEACDLAVDAIRHQLDKFKNKLHEK